MDSADQCRQPCQKPRRYCSHICGEPCHTGSECPDVPCKVATYTTILFPLLTAHHLTTCMNIRRDQKGNANGKQHNTTPETTHFPFFQGKMS